MSSQKIIIVTHEAPPFHGGIATYVSELANAATQMGKLVEIVAPNYGDASDGHSVKFVRLLGHHRLSLVGWLRTALFLATPTRRDALLHAADLRSAVLLFLFSLLLGRRYALTAHGSEARKLSGRALSARLLRRVYERADLVACNSFHTQQAIGKLARGANLKLTPLGVSSAWFAEPEPVFENQSLARLSEDACVICTVGRIERRKGHLQTIRALAPLFQTYPKLTYVIAGAVAEDGYFDEVKAMAVESPGRIVITGPLSFSDVRRLFAQSHCHVLAAETVQGKIEGYGLVVVEAAAQGCPSIATRVGGLPEAIIDGDTGIVVEPGDTPQLTRAVSSLLEDVARRDAIGRRSLARARSQTWERTALETYDTHD